MPGRPTLLMIVGQGPTALVVGAGGGCLDIFTLVYLVSSLSPFLWETARYRLKYCLKGPLNPKQPTDQCSAKYFFNLLLSHIQVFIRDYVHPSLTLPRAEGVVGWCDDAGQTSREREKEKKKG